MTPHELITSRRPSFAPPLHGHPITAPAQPPKQPASTTRPLQDRRARSQPQVVAKSTQLPTPETIQQVLSQLSLEHLTPSQAAERCRDLIFNPAQQPHLADLQTEILELLTGLLESPHPTNPSLLLYNAMKQHPNQNCCESHKRARHLIRARLFNLVYPGADQVTSHD